MKLKALSLAALTLAQLFALQPEALAQATAFTYQGWLNDGANPANGSYDLRFAVFGGDIGGLPLGGWVTNSATAVTNGLFTVTLDFGNQFPGSPRWIELAVRTNGGGAFTTLAPRQMLAATPYAIQALNSASAASVSGTVPATQISGTVPLAQLPAGVVTNGARGINLSGLFSGNGAGLTNVPQVSAASSWPGAFQPGSSPPVGPVPLGVAATDANGDGLLDLVSANSAANTVSVLTNRGDGFFALASTPGTGITPYSVASADFNGDGKVDLVTANNSGNTLSLLTNRGGGQFTLVASYGAGGGPTMVTVADVNGDGRMDVISADSLGNTLSVLINAGNGAFNPRTPLDLGASPNSVVAADVNGDGRVDLVATHPSNNTVSVLTNRGDGVFSLMAVTAAGAGPSSVAVVDVNGDGRTDLVTADYLPFSDNTLTTLTNNGCGGFEFATFVTLGGARGDVAIAPLDVNGDGRPDLACTRYIGATIELYLNDGSGRFTFVNAHGVGGGPIALVAADLNADGRTDLVTANSSGSTLTVLLNRRTFQGTFSGDGSGLTNLNLSLANLSSGTLADARLSANVALLDRNGQAFTGSNFFVRAQGVFGGDGSGLTNLNASQLTSGTLPLTRLPGAVVTNGASGVNISGTFSGNGAGITNFNATNLTGNVSMARLPASLVTNGASGVNLSGTFSGNGSGLTNLNASQLAGGTLSLARLPGTVVTNGASGVSFSGSFAGDGAALKNVFLSSIDSGGTFTWPGRFAMSSSPIVGAGPDNVTAADVNGDGKTDLVSAHSQLAMLTVLTNNGNGSFVVSSFPLLAAGALSVTSADVDGDGRPDLITAHYNLGRLTVLTNTGNGSFVVSTSPAVGFGPRSVSSADVNADGKPDLVSADSAADTLTVLTNTGYGGFSLSSAPAVGDDPWAVTSADVNGDGRPDLISANFGAGVGRTLTVLTNDGSGGFTLSSSPQVGWQPLSVTSADVNGDGKSDLISADHGDSRLTVLTNNGSGGFVASSSPAVSSFPRQVVSADVNGDNKPDLISAHITQNNLTVLTNNGSGNFFLSSSSAVGAGPLSVASADLNGDDKPDLISANSSAGTLSVLFNTPAFSGPVTGDGSGLTSVPATNLTGTVPDARLSANVALRAGGNTFSGNQTISGLLGLGTTTPGFQLDAVAGQSVARFTTTGSGNGSVMVLRNTTASPSYLGAINFENSGSTVGQIGYLAEDTMSFRVGGAERMRLNASGLTVNGTFVSASDRNVKEDFAAVNAQEVLEKVAALPLQSWSYTNRPGVKHVGPMAQDFRAAFGLGEDDKHIATVDADGVALAAIQGLNQKLTDELKRKETEITKLQLRLEALEQLILERKTK